jgi:hypothetical protein
MKKMGKSKEDKRHLTIQQVQQSKFKMLLITLKE